MEPPVGAAFGGALAGGGVTEDLARISSAADGIILLLLAAGIASLLKLAQGSGTVAILTGSAIVASLLSELDALAFHPGYLFAAVGFGSMAASWMNDSRFLGGGPDVRIQPGRHLPHLDGGRRRGGNLRSGSGLGAGRRLPPRLRAEGLKRTELREQSRGARKSVWGHLRVGSRSLWRRIGRSCWSRVFRYYDQL